MGMNSFVQTVFSASVITALAAIGTYIYQKRRGKEAIPTKWEQVGKITKIRLYPLKSGHRIELDRAEVTEFGLKQSEEDEKIHQMRDRSLVVYAERDHEFRTARTYPKMILIDVSVHDENHLAIDAPTMRTLYVKIPNMKDSKQIAIKLHKNEEVQAIDCGDEAASWFSRYILEQDSGLRLGFHPANRKRDIAKVHKKILNYYIHLGNDSAGLYTDLTSVLLLNQQSVQDLQKRIGNSSISVENFRPNLVVDSSSLQPYAEDEWDWIKIGDVVLRNVKDCTRCILTTINPENATRNPDREPLKTLEKYRMSKGPEKNPIMGINLEVRQTGFINVGDTVFFARAYKNN